jgi:hypothetical protein
MGTLITVGDELDYYIADYSEMPEALVSRWGA